MARIEIDTSKATRDVEALGKQLDTTNKSARELEDSSDDLGKALDNAGKSAENLSEGINVTDSVLNALAGTTGKMGGLAGEAIRKTIPALKNGLRSTTLSFRTLGKAIAATGIGLIVEGVALLIANFKEITMWVKNFAKTSQQALPGVSRLITNISEAFAKIKNRIREIAENFGNSKFGKMLGLDKAVSKFKEIRDAASEATAMTKAQLEAMDELNTKVGGGRVSREKEDKGPTRKEVDPLEQVSAASNSLIAQKSADAATIATKQQTDATAGLVTAQKEQAKWLQIIQKLLKQEGDEAALASQKLKDNTMALTNSIASVSGSLATMVEKNGAAYKALMTTQIISTTLAGAMTAFTATDNVTMLQKWAQFAAILATGAAQLKALYADSLSTQTVTAVTPTLSGPMSGAQTAVTTAQITATQQSKEQVYITDKQLQDNRQNEVQLKKNTVW